MKLSKIICWCIWNERNHRIFQDKFQPAWKIAAKANSLLGEVVSISKIPNNKEKLTDTENNWMQSLNIMAANSMNAKNSEDWEIRMDKSQFENWLRERKNFKLFSMEPPKGILDEREEEELFWIREGKSRYNTTGTLDATPIIWSRLMGFGKVSSS